MEKKILRTLIQTWAAQANGVALGTSHGSSIQTQTPQLMKEVGHGGEPKPQLIGRAQ